MYIIIIHTDIVPEIFVLLAGSHTTTEAVDIPRLAMLSTRVEQFARAFFVKGSLRTVTLAARR